MINQTFLSRVDTMLGHCGLLVCHIGKVETIGNLPTSYLKSHTSQGSTLHHNVANSNRWVQLIDVMQQIQGFQNIVDYNEHHHKFVIGMKCKECRSNWIWNAASFQIQMTKRIHEKNPPSLLDGPTIMSYQFSSRIVEEVWCREEENQNDRHYCHGHGYDPDMGNVPISALVVGTSRVANGGRGVFTSQHIPKGSYIALDDCVNGIIIPIATLELLNTASYAMENVSEFWEVVLDGFIDGYGWSDSFLVCLTYNDLFKPFVDQILTRNCCFFS